MQLTRGEAADLLRSAGGVLLAVGALVVLARKSGEHQWSAFAHLLVVLIPAALLYALALGARGRPDAERAEPWRAVLLVVATLLVPVVLLEFLRWVGASTHEPLYNAAVAALTALLAGYGAWRARVPYAALIAGLAALVAWLVLWGQILDHPSADTFRWLLVAAGVLLLAAAAALGRRDAVGAREVATSGGVAAVAAGVLGVVVGAVVGVLQTVSSSFGESSSGVGSATPGVVTTTPLHITRGGGGIGSNGPFGHLHASGVQHFGWDVYLLLVSLALVWLGARVRARGLGYAGGAGLLAFLVSVSLQVARLVAGHSPKHDIVGWPLALVIAGVAALVVAPVYGRARE